MQNIILNKINEIIKTSKPDGIVTRLKHNEELWSIILDFTKNIIFKNKAEQIYFYSQQFTVKPVCKCGKPLSFVSITLGYREFCSRSCDYAKEAALDRRVAAMKANGGVGLANPKTYLKAKGKLQEKHGLDVTNPGQIKSHIHNMTVNNPMFDVNISNKQKLTNITKYGRPNAAQRYIPEDIWKILNDKNLFEQIVTGKTSQQIKDELNLYSTSKALQYVRKHNLLDKIIFHPQSAMEHDLKIWLDSKGISYQQHNRSILPNNYELDFYFPQWNFAIELHGLFHHSELAGNKDKTYHAQKYKGCQIKGVQLLQIWQDEYWKHREVVQSKILYLANLITNKIPARKCVLAPLTNTELERDFMNKNHIQGHADYRQWSLGAWFNDELVGVMGFSDQMNRLELVRYATRIDSVASGLFSKMLKKSIEEFKFSGNMISLSDNRISNGRLYLNSGFSYLEELKPGYCYTTDYNSRINRQHCMKPKLIKRHNLDPNIVNTMTEWELAQELGYDRLWDAGKVKWLYKIT